MSKFTIQSIMMTLMSFAFIATLSNMQLAPNLITSVHAQQFPVASPSNSTSLTPLSNLSLGNRTGESLVESFGPLSQMEDVIKQIQNTNATSFAARQQIESITSNMSDNASNTAGTTLRQNLTGDSTNDTAMKAVIEQTKNTNATGFAANNLINMTSPQAGKP